MKDQNFFLGSIKLKYVTNFFHFVTIILFPVIKCDVQIFLNYVKPWNWSTEW